ncbi:hypothetical protein Tco_0043433 [Tanacetum coccineum]
MKIKESPNVTFDETPLPSKTSPLVDDDLDEEEQLRLLMTYPRLRYGNPPHEALHLRGGPSMKLEQMSDSQTYVLHFYPGLPAKIEIDFKL